MVCYYVILGAEGPPNPFHTWWLGSDAVRMPLKGECPIEIDLSHIASTNNIFIHEFSRVEPLVTCTRDSPPLCPHQISSYVLRIFLISDYLFISNLKSCIDGQNNLFSRNLFNK